VILAIDVAQYLSAGIQKDLKILMKQLGIFTPNLTEQVEPLPSLIVMPAPFLLAAVRAILAS